jgi:hypothetical protein
MCKNLKPRDVLAQAAHLLVLRQDLALRGAPAAAGIGVQRRRRAGGEGSAQVGEAVELAVLREEHLHDGAHRQPVVLDGVRRGLRRQLPRVDQPPQRLPLLFSGAWMCLVHQPINRNHELRTERNVAVKIMKIKKFVIQILDSRKHVKYSE